MYGYEQIMNFAPEAVEDLTSTTYALFKDGELADATEERWKEVDVWFQAMQLQAFFRENPEVNPNIVARAYKTKDKSLNFRLLYQKLLAVSENFGVQTLLNTEVIPEREGKATLVDIDGSRRSIFADIFVFTTGLAARKIFSMLDYDMAVRFWKSHSVMLPRLSKNGFFFVDPLEASVMPHGKFSIACQSEDDFQIVEPTFDVVPHMAHQVFEALVRMVPDAKQYADEYHSNACVKPDIIKGPNSPRSVDIELHEPMPNYFVAFPGKVTESPYMADTVVKTIFDRKSDNRISQRPGDIIYGDDTTK
jgi:glycine/D-amino acid oxidase-like deaminating enzyme